MKVPGPKHAVNIKYENKYKNHANHVHTFRKWSVTWSQFVLSARSNHWLIRHSMVCTAIYSSHDSNLIKFANQARIAEVRRKPVVVLRCFIQSKPLFLQWLFILPLVVQWINFCLMYSLHNNHSFYCFCFEAFKILCYTINYATNLHFVATWNNCMHVNH